MMYIFTWDEMVKTFKWKSLHRYFVWYDFEMTHLLIDSIPEFYWPGFTVRARPFDWMIDDA